MKEDRYREWVAVIEQVGDDYYARPLWDKKYPVRLIDTKTSKIEPNRGDVVHVYDDTQMDGIQKYDVIAKHKSAQARAWKVASIQGFNPIHTTKATEETQALVQSMPSSIHDVDLVNKPFFAVDNQDSKDIDQAMWLSKNTESGMITIHYALADGSALSPQFETLWNESLEKGSSTYLPSLPLHMLPEKLSTGSLSLNAHEVRRALVAKIDISAEGQVLSTESFYARIRSKAQLTYDGVSEHVELEKHIRQDAYQQPLITEVAEQLPLMKEVGTRLEKNGRQRGVIPFEREELRTVFRGNRFRLERAASNEASKWNAQISVLANTELAKCAQTYQSPVRDRSYELQNIYRTQLAAPSYAQEAMYRRIQGFVEKLVLPSSWSHSQDESLADYIDRLHRLPRNPQEEVWARLIENMAMGDGNQALFSSIPGSHASLAVDVYMRFTAPMREMVGIVSHRLLEASLNMQLLTKHARWQGDVLPELMEQTLLMMFRLRAVVPEAQWPRECMVMGSVINSIVDTLQTSSPTTNSEKWNQLSELLEKIESWRVKLDDQILDQGTEAMEEVLRRVTEKANAADQRQGSLDSKVRQLLFDDLFLKDLSGVPFPTSLENIPVHRGVVMVIGEDRIIVRVPDSQVDVRLNVFDLGDGDARKIIMNRDEGWVKDKKGARIKLGDAIDVQATHHDGNKLHFRWVRNRTQPPF